MPRLAEVLEHREGEVAGAEHDDPNLWGHGDAAPSRLGDRGRRARQPGAVSAASTGWNGPVLVSSCLTISASGGYSPPAWAWWYWVSNSRSLSLIEWRASDAEMIDEELAVEVVDLVLDRPAEEVFGLVLDELALEVEGLDLDLLGAADLGVEPGQARGTLPRPRSTNAA